MALQKQGRTCNLIHAQWFHTLIRYNINGSVATLSRGGSRNLKGGGGGAHTLTEAFSIAL